MLTTFVVLSAEARLGKMSSIIDASDVGSSAGRDDSSSEQPLPEIDSIGGYTLHQKLGEGHFAMVYLATNSSGDRTALKVIEKKRIQRLYINREIEAMQAVNHKNVLKLINAQLDVPFPRSDGLLREVFLLELEFAPGGELFNYLLVTGPLLEHFARAYLLQMLEGIQECHSNGVYHRDLKPDNILLDRKFVLKLGDFGLASLNPSNHLLMTNCGTQGYQAPEVLTNAPYDGAAADVWSVGVILFIMLVGHPPFRIAGPGDWWFKAVRLNRYDKFWKAHQRAPCKTVHPEAQAFLNSIFVVDPSKRATVEELLASPWLTDGSRETAAPIPDEETICAHMQSRKDAMDEKARLEREKILAKQRDQRAQTTFDPYDTPVYRNMSPGNEESDESGDEDDQDAAFDFNAREEQTEFAKPSVALTSLSPFRFYASESPAELLDMLEAACQQLQNANPEPPAVDRSTFQISATIGDAANAVSFQLRISKSDEDSTESSLWVVDASRGALGTPWAFLHQWREIVSLMSRMGCEGAGVAAIDKDMMEFQMPLPPPDDDLLEESL